MLGTFAGLNIAVSGLGTNQSLLDVVAQNVDNANTSGYSRQLARTGTLPSVQLMGLGSVPLQVGTGVQVEQITRARNGFLDTQYRQQNQSLGQATVMQNTMNKITAIVNDPSSTGLSTAMQNFWTAWGKLGSNPGDLSAAEELQQNAQSVTSTLNQMASQYTQMTSDLNSQLNATAIQANSYITQIAKLNGQIDAIGGSPNNLLDSRDLLLDKLSNLTDVTTNTTSQGELEVSIGGTKVISGGTVLNTLEEPGSTQTGTPVPLTSVTGGQIKGLENSLSTVGNYQADLNTFASQLANGKMNVKLAGDWQVPVNAGQTLPVTGTLPDGTSFTAGDPISNYTTAPSGKPEDKVTVDTSVTPNILTIPAGTTIDNVQGLNGILQLGYAQNGQVDPSVADSSIPAGSGFPDFFVSSDGNPLSASNISVGVTAGQVGYALRPAISVDSSGNKTFSQSDAGLSGDGTLAVTANDMQNADLNFSSNNSAANITGTLSDFWQGEVGQLGIDSQRANNQVTNQTALVQQIDQQRQSVSGVNLDEEMANMVKYQQAYTASAKVVTSINSMLTSLMQMVP